jgi:hypothetical protein
MAPDDDNEDFHRRQQELEDACVAGDVIRIRQLFFDAELDAAEASSLLLSSEGYPLATLRCLLELGADPEHFIPWGAADEQIQSLEVMELLVEFGYDVKSRGHLILQ